MSNAAASHAPHDHSKTRKEYIKVFFYLCALTVIEVAVVYLKNIGVPELVVALLVVIFSSSKAVLVGWYYMHLKSETKWLKAVALLPIIAFGYAFFLGLDLKVYPRVMEDYMGAPARVHTSGHQHNIQDLPMGSALDEVVEKLPADTVQPRSALGLETPLDQQAAGTPPGRTEEEAAPTPGTPTEAAAPTGTGGEWK